MPIDQRDIVRVPVQPFHVSKATVASLWKCGFMKDTFIRGRSTFEKLQRSSIGDFAKLCLKTWLEDQGFTVLDWDDVRENWRSQRKPYDLQVNEHNIEVRSSIAHSTNIRTILAEEHIIQPSNVRTKEITVQVFFLNQTCNEALLFGWAYGADLEDPNLRSPRRIGRLLIDFYFLPFNDARARTMTNLLTIL